MTDLGCFKAYNIHGEIGVNIDEGVAYLVGRAVAQHLGLGHSVLCVEPAVGEDPFAVLLADDFLTDYAPGVTADLAQAFASSGKSQLSVMEVDGII
jgi:UTP--glucose-1-phosphate uridylyltransferase